MNDEEEQIPSYSLEEGEFLVKLARKSILNYLAFKTLLPLPEAISEKLQEESGVFVTLNQLSKHGEKNLRGCIGYPTPIFPLIQATIQAAKSAAVEDPRFPEVAIDEMEKIIVEVTILTPPRLLKVKNPEEYLEKIKIGRDGLIIKGVWGSGLLLPQVPIEWEWNVEEFLDHTCGKAGLPSNCWKDPNTEVMVFSGIIFQETEPNGEVVQKEI